MFYVRYTDGDNRWEDFACKHWVLATIDQQLLGFMAQYGNADIASLQQGRADDIIVDRAVAQRKSSSRAVLTRSDILHSLGLGCWLNDVVLDLALNLVCNARHANTIAMNSLFYGRLVGECGREPNHHRPDLRSVDTWVQPTAFLCDRIAIAVHVCCGSAQWFCQAGNHWCLAVVDLARKRLLYYDPLPASRYTSEQGEQCVGNLKHWLMKKMPVVTAGDMGWVGKCQYSESLRPIQGNSFDCGMFVVMYALCAGLGISLHKLPFGQQHMASLRQQLLAHMLSRST
jgi:Ulp1 family protease